MWIILRDGWLSHVAITWPNPHCIRMRWMIHYFSWDYPFSCGLQCLPANLKPATEATERMLSSQAAAVMQVLPAVGRARVPTFEVSGTHGKTSNRWSLSMDDGSAEAIASQGCTN